MQRSFATPYGPIRLSGDLAGVGPLVLVIRGAYATEDQLSRLPEHVPAAVAFGDIPGHRSSWLEDQTLAVCAAAYSDAVDQLGRPAVVCGVSLGGLIALGMRTKLLHGVLALDPPFRPAETAHMRRAAATAYAQAGSDHERAFLRSVFGARPEGIEPRDHLPVLSGLAAPAHILAGDPDATDVVASVLSEATYQDVVRSGVSAERMSGVGHAVWRGGSDRIVQALRALLAPALQAPTGPKTRAQG
jgi:pimeloyl-ACP methyl ester carboxylesterase